MARCRCQSEACTCAIRAGEGVAVSGSGSPSDPWVVSAPPDSSGTLRVQDTPTIDLVLSGEGTLENPYILTGHTSSLPGGISTGHGITGLGNGANPLRIDLCTYDDIAALAACAP
jgi:hypothetical protein